MVHITNWENLLTHVIDSYGKGNRNGSLVLDAVGEGCGQAFTSPLSLARLTDAVFQLQRNAAFIAPGAIEARLYRVLAGTVVGTTAVPDIAGGVLATSDPVVAADIELAWGVVNFHFGTPDTLDPELGYVIVVVVTNCPAGGQVEVGIDTTILPLHFPSHSGNETDNLTLPPVWTPNPLNDVIFYLFSFSDVLAGGVVDVSDRWARQLGQIDLARVLGAALSAANPVITGIFDAAANRMPSMDAVARPGFVDPIDRAARLLGVTYGSQAQQLQQKAATFELLVEDTGVNTNPERYIQDNKFSSVPIDRAGAVATLLYGLTSPVAHRRTAGLSTTVWWVWYHNHSGGAATVWLEAPVGTSISARTQVADNQSVVFEVKPLDIGDNDVYVNADADNVEAQVGGVEV